jgi:hypothetical protein
MGELPVSIELEDFVPPAGSDRLHARGKANSRGVSRETLLIGIGRHTRDKHEGFVPGPDQNSLAEVSVNSGLKALTQ